MTMKHVVAAVACSLAIAITVPAYAGQRGHGGGTARGGAVGRASPGSAGSHGGIRGPVTGQAVPRPLLPSRPLLGSPHYLYGYPRFGFGLYYGYPYGYHGYYGYPYSHGRYGYPYGYGYGYPYGYGYGLYGYDGYPYGYGYGTYGTAVGYIRITGAPREAEVYVDGSYGGIVDDFDGTLQRLTLVAGAHRIELRAPGLETATFDVNVRPGQTVHYRAVMKESQREGALERKGDVYRGQ